MLPFPAVKKSICHQNLATYLFRAVLAWSLICADFSPDSDQNTFSLEEASLWIMNLYFKLKFLKDGFVLQTRSFWLLKTLTDGLVWITCGLL